MSKINRMPCSTCAEDSLHNGLVCIQCGSVFMTAKMMSEKRYAEKVAATPGHLRVLMSGESRLKVAGERFKALGPAEAYHAAYVQPNPKRHSRAHFGKGKQRTVA